MEPMLSSSRFWSFFGSLALFFQCAEDFEEPLEPPPPPEPPAVTVPFPEAMFVQNGCASCHGEKGDGRGSRSDLLGGGRMPNFQDKGTYLYGSSPSEIAKSIRQGIPGTYMKSYRYMRAGEIQALADYVHSMQK